MLIGGPTRDAAISFAMFSILGFPSPAPTMPITASKVANSIESASTKPRTTRTGSISAALTILFATTFGNAAAKPIELAVDNRMVALFIEPRGV